MVLGLLFIAYNKLEGVLIVSYTISVYSLNYCTETYLFGKNSCHIHTLGSQCVFGKILYDLKSSGLEFFLGRGFPPLLLYYNVVALGWYGNETGVD